MFVTTVIKCWVMTFLMQRYS